MYQNENKVLFFHIAGYGRMRCFGFVQHGGTFAMMILFACIVGLTSVPSIHIFRSFSGRSILLDAVLIGHGIVLQNVLHLWTCAVLSRMSSMCVKQGIHPLHSWSTIGWGGAMAFHRMCLLILPAYVPTFVGQIYYEIAGLPRGRM